MTHSKILAKLHRLQEQFKNGTRLANPKDVHRLANKLFEAELMIEKIFKNDSPPYQTTLTRLNRIFLNGDGMPLITSLQGESKAEAIDVYHLLYDMLVQRGYRNLYYIMTTQEHKLLGSSGYLGDASPYVPLALITNEMSVDEVKKARELEVCFEVFNKWFVTFRGAYFPEENAQATLEKLNIRNETVEDPRAVFRLNGQLKIKEIEQATGFPYGRSKCHN